MTYNMHVELFFPFDSMRPLGIPLRFDFYDLTPEEFEFSMSRKLRRLRENRIADIKPQNKLIGWRIWRDEVVIAQWGKVP